MARTRQEIIELLATRKVSQKLKESVWSDLQAAIQDLNASNRDMLVNLIAQNKAKEVGELLHKLLLKNAKDRSIADITTLLADDVISLAELDSLL